MSRVDLSKDYLGWDNTEAATLESTRRTGSMISRIEVVKRRAITAREVQASGGAYVPSDVNWHIPAAELPTNIVPKKGDVVVDGQSNRWTCIEIAHNKHDYNGPQTYKMVCRNLTIQEDLKHVIDIQRPEITFDAAGVKVKRWPDDDDPRGSVVYDEMAARVQLQSQEIADEHLKRGFRETYSVIVDRQVAVEDEDRIKWTHLGVTKYLDITGVQSPDRFDELPVISAVLNP